MLLTDGLTEVFDKHGKEMGLEAVKDILRKLAKQPLPDLSASIRQAALNFRKAGRRPDDAVGTLFVAREGLGAARNGRDGQI
jgi:serine phosphatase RsbU (regulator of sigma subunit)